jgi:hypothetical protein
MNALDDYKSKAATKAEENARQLTAAEIVGAALETAGIDGTSLSVEEGPCRSLMGDYQGRRYLSIRIESFPCKEDEMPTAWI